ncbi:MAG: hypothetical protein JO336_06395 [Acidobacteriia bacterium]|nr:hypothetical protein [Terriglobia bacterium]
MSDVSAAQLAASEARPRSSLAALRHELTRQIFLVPENDLEPYRAHCQAIVDSYEIVGPREQVLAQSIAEQRWSINRIRALANNLLARSVALQPLLSDHPDVNAAVAQAESFVQNHPVFNTLSLYEHRTYRNMEKDLKELNSLQAERKARAAAEAEAKAKAEAEKAQAQMEEAIKLHNLYKSALRSAGIWVRFFE